ncbi:MAG: RNA polymerase sigma factor [Planctomycetota bacterium]|jgi:RNA polymerase sigma-70 factor (ECF subfamily)
MVENKLLIWKFKAGNSDALQRIYEKYKTDLLRLALALARDLDVAEDVVQDVFVNFARSGPKLTVRRNLKSYLAACVANQVRNQIRYQQRHPVSAMAGRDCPAADSKSPQHWAILSEEMEILRGAMAQIPYEQREVLTLYAEGNMTFRQIAKLQAAGLSTVKGRYRYGLNKLRSILNSKVKK